MTGCESDKRWVQRRGEGLARTLIEEVWTAGDLAALTAITASEFRLRAPGQPTLDREAAVEYIAAVRAAVPSLSREVRAVHVTDDVVVVEYVQKGARFDPAKPSDVAGVDASGADDTFEPTARGVFLGCVGDDVLLAGHDYWNCVGLDAGPVDRDDTEADR
jgi:hypothetical protein